MTLPDSIPLRRDSTAGPGFGEGADFSGVAALGLLLVFAILAITWWRKHRAPKAGSTDAASTVQPRWARWLGAQRNTGISPVANTRLTPKHSLHEVEWQGKRLLIGCAEHSICLLAETPVQSNPHASVTHGVAE